VRALQVLMPEEWQALNEDAQKYLRFRILEIAQATGKVSAAVASLLRVEAEAYSDAMYLRSTAHTGILGDQLEKAHRLNSVGMRAAAQAWALANSEASARGKGRTRRDTVPEPEDGRSLADDLE